MRIRNMRKFSLYFPYAGLARGNVVKTGELSVELPTERFYDVLLQRDWQRGIIEVELNEMDTAILGPSVAGLYNKKPEQPKPEQVITIPAEVVRDVVIHDMPDSLVEKLTGQPVHTPKTPIEEAVAKSVTEPVNTDTKRCKLCNGIEHVTMDDRVHLEVCRYCKVKITSGHKLNQNGELIPPPKATFELNPTVIQPKSDKPTIPKPTAGRISMPVPPVEERVPGQPYTPPPSNSRNPADISQLLTQNREIPFGMTPNSTSPSGVPDTAAKLAKADEILRGPIGSPLGTMSRPPKPKARIED